MKKLIAGNWKMNTSMEEARALISSIATKIKETSGVADGCTFLVCPPYPYISEVKSMIDRADAPVLIGGQDCARTDNGAYTGNVSAAMLKDLGCEYVILGHSERREYHTETSELVAQKAAKAHEEGLKTIICVGETEKERAAGHEVDVVTAQLQISLPESATAENTVIAYEPVWAIGTGKTATEDDVKAMHKFIREKLKERLADSEQMLILYGGSMKPANAETLLSTPNVDGGLIGGASLNAEDYLGIAEKAPA